MKYVKSHYESVEQMNICHDFKPQLSEILSPQNNSILVITRLVFKKNCTQVLIYNLDFINRELVEICFHKYSRASILPLGPQKKFANPQSRPVQECLYI